MFLNRDFAWAREIIQTSLTLDSGTFVAFIQMFGPLLICSYYLVLVLCIFNKILKVLIFSGKVVVTVSPCKNPCLKTFLDVNFLFVNQSSKILRHILGLKEY